MINEKLTVISDIISMLMKATKFCKQKCYFLISVCLADDQVAP